MIEQDIKNLIADPYIPITLSKKLLEGLFAHWQTNAANDPLGSRLDSLAHACYNLMKERETWLTGPVLSGKGRSIRVAQIHRFQSIVRLFHSEIRWLLSSTIQLDESQVTNEQISDIVERVNEVGERGLMPQYLRPNVRWVTIAEEILSATTGDLQAGLSLLHLQPNIPLFSLSYEIDWCELHIPTILDAMFYREFVPKPLNLSELPRAWNWSEQTWGFTEMVHRSEAPISRPRLSFLGWTKDNAFGQVHGGMLDFTFPHSAHLERIVAQMLRSVSAHQELEPFLNGERDVLNLDPWEFERFVALLHEREGYRADVTRRSKDGGIDVIAFSDLGTPDALVIQAKHSRNTVGIRVLRELAGARLFAGDSLNSHVLSVVTTGRFSREARKQEGQSTAPIKLIDYFEIQRRLRGFASTGNADIIERAIRFSEGLYSPKSV